MKPSSEPSQTKDRLLRAAMTEFADHGFAGARVDRIVKAAGLNKQAVYYYFADKDDLYRNVLERCYELAHQDDEDIRRCRGTGAQAMEFLVERTFSNLENLRDVIYIVSDENRNRGRHLPNDKARAINRPLIDAIGEILMRGEADGTLRGNVDPEQLWMTIISSIMFYFSNMFTISNLLDRDLSTKPELTKRKRFITQFVLAALRP